MTNEALRQFELIAKHSSDSSYRERASVFANQLRLDLERGKMPRTLLDAGITSPLLQDRNILDQDSEDADAVGHSRFVLRGRANVVQDVEGRTARLTPTEGILTRVLYEHTGETLTRKQILAANEGWNDTDDPTIVNVYIFRVRKKLYELGLHDEKFPNGYLISVNKAGYAIVDPAVQEQVRKYERYALDGRKNTR